MRKLSIMLIVVATAMFANASTFKWGITTTESLDQKNFASGTAYLFYGSVGTSGLALPSTEGFDKKMSYSVSDFTSSTATQFKSGAVKDGAFMSEAESITGIGGSTGNYAFYMVVISDDGKYAALVTSTKTARIMSSTTAASTTWAATAFNTFSASGIPEPTSGLLLVLGGAMLALRRRRA